MGMLMSEISAATVSEWLKNYSAVISEHANELTDLDLRSVMLTTARIWLAE